MGMKFAPPLIVPFCSHRRRAAFRQPVLTDVKNKMTYCRHSKFVNLHEEITLQKIFCIVPCYMHHKTEKMFHLPTPDKIVLLFIKDLQ